MGVSMAEVVMEDMAIGNPASLSAQLALWALFPGIHIAQSDRASNWQFGRNSPDALQHSADLVKS
jgi:hypothetical protein